MSANTPDTSQTERIPFYRNVKTIGILAQIIFLVAVVVSLVIVSRNIITEVQKLGIPLGFGWLDDRSGIPLTESPIPYDENTHSYGRVIWIGLLNTLKVSLVGVVLATFLGIGVALMRLSNNWMLRQIATVYIESVRNIPLAVQIFFWFTVMLIPSLPIGVNALSLADAFLNNSSGLALPWPYYTQNIRLWLPWLLGALIVAFIFYRVRRAQIIRSERPGNPWPLTLVLFCVVAIIGYVVAIQRSQQPEGLTIEVSASRGRVTSFIDTNGNGTFDKRTESTVRAVPVVVRVPEGTFTTIPDKRTELRQTVHSGFRFVRLKDSEFSTAEVSFTNPDQAEGLSIHFDKYPSVGRIYRDRNGNGKLDKGEELRTPEEIAASERGEQGYEGSAYQVQLTITDFERHLVTDPFGEAKFPRFRGQEAVIEIKPSGPFVMSYPSFPTARTLIVGGNIITNPYMALLFALVFYTATFIAEIVRGGILSVAKGQREAAQALGLSASQTFRLVVFPQAMRIIIPPLISQYLNLTKNSSLGFLAAYNEFFKISEIIANQSGAIVPMVTILIIGYLLISLSFSLILNIFNERVKLKER